MGRKKAEQECGGLAKKRTAEAVDSRSRSNDRRTNAAALAVIRKYVWRWW